MRPCPTGCGDVTAPGRLMCRRCWARVPRDLQRDVYRTWQAWRRHLSDGDRMRAYTEAADRALGAV